MGGLARLGRATMTPRSPPNPAPSSPAGAPPCPPTATPGCRLYDWEKLLGGLLDLHAYADEPDALPVLRQTAEWAAAPSTAPAPPPTAMISGAPGLAIPRNGTPSPRTSTAPSFIPVTRSTATSLQVWHYDAFWDRFANGPSPAVVHAGHAYSHVNSFASAAMAHAITGERCLLDICVNAYDFMQATQCYATASAPMSVSCHLMAALAGRSISFCTYHAEEPCGAWAGFKLASYLINSLARPGSVTGLSGC
jgi:hypothetical protein